MKLFDFLTGLCAMAVLCSLCDLITPDTAIKKCTHSIISLCFLLYVATGIMKLINI